MDSSFGVLGAVIGLTIWTLAGTVAAQAAYEAAANSAQRAVLRQLYGIGGTYAAALMGLVLLVGLSLLPTWVYGVAFILWFGPLLPVLAWLHHRLEATASESESALSAAA
jgi:hypothetical protein